MIEKSRYAQAFTYVSASVLLSVAALFAGLIVARRLFA
jgi:CrcB protein